MYLVDFGQLDLINSFMKLITKVLGNRFGFHLTKFLHKRQMHT